MRPFWADVIAGQRHAMASANQKRCAHVQHAHPCLLTATGTSSASTQVLLLLLEQVFRQAEASAAPSVPTCDVLNAVMRATHAVCGLP